MRYGIGLDIGSTCAKTAVVGEDGGIMERILQPTGWSSVETAMRDTDQDRSTYLVTRRDSGIQHSYTPLFFVAEISW